MKRSICVLVFAGLVFAAFCSGQKPPLAPAAPASQPSGAAVSLTKMKSLMDRPRGMPRNADPVPIMKRRLPKALSALAEMEQKYPKAKELHEARLMGIFAAIKLAQINKDLSIAKRAKQIAGKILASDAPDQIKLHADANLLFLNIRPVSAATTMPSTQPAKRVDTTKLILQFTKRYAKTDQAIGAVMIGMQIAQNVGDRKTFDKLLQQLPFNATLTKLDGTKLNLPKDLLGKVLVIDFWATWCRPCVQTLPHLKSLYARYKPRGVEIVGISLDKDPQRLKSFVATNKLGWIITYSGKGWEDPTARKYGIQGIPSVWVIGKDGKIVSNNARGNLAETIEKALSASITKPTPTTRPAKKADK
ncbi:MAG: TlpA family protein disulfide reductase [Phycisphaerae bacterium]|nr:TlpA family protein disulfide reductase [Phycisphaerae bacterium]